MMMLCTRCHKRPATVFVSQSSDGRDAKGYCFVCAKELGIKQVNDLMDNMMNTLKEQTGITEEEFQEATEQMAQMMRMDAEEAGEDPEDEGEDDFSPGGRGHAAHGYAFGAALGGKRLQRRAGEEGERP